MGHFFAVTAFKTENEKLVSDAIVEYSTAYDVKARALDKVNEPNEKSHAILFPQANGWCVVIWPRYFNIHDVPLAKTISEKYSLLVSTVNVYDGDYWCHYLFNAGEEIDAYCSIPNYWAESESESEDSINKFKGNPELVAQYMGIEKTNIEGYYQHLLEDKEYGKVYSEDESELDDFWVFTDFWNKLGIEYPADIMSFNSVVDLTKKFDSKFPEIEA